MYKLAYGELRDIMQDESDEVTFKKLLKRVHLQLLKFHTKQQDMHTQGRHLNMYEARRHGETSRLKTTKLEIECLEYSKL